MITNGERTAWNTLMAIGGAVAVSVMVTWAVLTAHAQVPHKGSIVREEYAKDIGDIKADIREIRKSLTRIAESRTVPPEGHPQ